MVNHLISVGYTPQGAPWFNNQFNIDPLIPLFYF